MDFSNFSFDTLAQYERMRIETDKCAMFLAYGALGSIAQPTAAFLRELYWFFKRYAAVSGLRRTAAIEGLYRHLKGRQAAIPLPPVRP